ncbi:hypothetical protein HH_0406 [Helicobacter hepaticus ATCC 51449]|uniref:Uncharacterized protein n=1 Tax=Helicobacter hepaticus (strain ATCC 51449 / 3B1) TaxID=235279 RepID=Q7VJ37_HELHP|nr:hypothetical protein HH_0406 [Helicobacter hepaticus ATCC 51449]
MHSFKGFAYPIDKHTDNTIATFTIFFNITFSSHIYSLKNILKIIANKQMILLISFGNLSLMELKLLHLIIVINTLFNKYLS